MTLGRYKAQRDRTALVTFKDDVQTVPPVKRFPAGTTKLTGDLDLFVDPATGSDLNDGSASAPFATIVRVLDELRSILPGEFNIVVHVAAGVYKVPEKRRAEVVFGGRAMWEGGAVEFPDTSPLVLSEFGSTSTPDDEFENVEFVDCKVKFPAPLDLKVGYFVVITAAVGGTNTEVVKGSHEVIAVNTRNRVATIRLWLPRNATRLPQGRIMASGQLIRSIVNFEKA